MIYLDNAATTKPCTEAIEAFNAVAKCNFGNPSSLHHLGVMSEAIINETKKVILNKLNLSGEIIFTSGATESNNIALQSLAITQKHVGTEIVSTEMEHPSVYNTLDNLFNGSYAVKRVAPCHNMEDALLEAVTDKTAFVSVMAVNNETGFKVDTVALYNKIKAKNARTLVHIDGVQGFCKVPLMGDLISISAHKIHGFKGVGALYYNKCVRLQPLFFGGEQQKRIRPGTECVELIAGFGEAVKVYPNLLSKFQELNIYLLKSLAKIEKVVYNSGVPSEDYYPAIANFSVLGIKSEIMLHFLEDKGIYVSSGSACSKGKSSRVLESFGIPKVTADTALRISFCGSNTLEDIDTLVEALSEAILRFRR